MTPRWTPFEIVTGAGAAFLAIAFACVFVEAARIEAGLAARAVAVLEATGLHWYGVAPKGRRLVVTGAAADADIAERAAAEVAAVSGAGSIENRITVIGSAGACQLPLDAAHAELPVAFRKGVAELVPATEPVIAAVAAVIVRCRARVEVAVHADAGGSAALGLTLSQRRAEQLARRLAAHGVPAGQLIATGYGTTQPVASARASAPPGADDHAAAGRTIGQRVEFRGNGQGDVIYLIGEIILYLLAALVVGGGAGWLLSEWRTDPSRAADAGPTRLPDVFAAGVAVSGPPARQLEADLVRARACAAELEARAAVQVQEIEALTRRLTGAEQRMQELERERALQNRALQVLHQQLEYAIERRTSQPVRASGTAA